MTLVICNTPSVKATMEVHTQEDYLKACGLIDSCIERGISVGVATNNQTIANWLTGLYQTRCTVIFD